MPAPFLIGAPIGSVRRLDHLGVLSSTCATHSDVGREVLPSESSRHQAAREATRCRLLCDANFHQIERTDAARRVGRDRGDDATEMRPR
jgi:hypothetical protein